MSPQTTLSTAESVVYEAYDAMENLDVERVAPLLADDIQAVDAVMRDWKRGLGELGEHLATLESTLEDEESHIQDMVVREYGDVAIATYVVRQHYTISGQRYDAVAPTTMILRREGGSWKIALFHSIPLPSAP